MKCTFYSAGHPWFCVPPTSKTLRFAHPAMQGERRKSAIWSLSCPTACPHRKKRVHWPPVSISPTGNRTRVSRVKAEYPSRLDYRGVYINTTNCYLYTADADVFSPIIAKLSRSLDVWMASHVGTRNLDYKLIYIQIPCLLVHCCRVTSQPYRLPDESSVHKLRQVQYSSLNPTLGLSLFWALADVYVECLTRAA